MKGLGTARTVTTNSPSAEEQDEQKRTDLDGRRPTDAQTRGAHGEHCPRLLGRQSARKTGDGCRPEHSVLCVVVDELVDEEDVREQAARAHAGDISRNESLPALSVGSVMSPDVASFTKQSPAALLHVLTQVLHRDVPVKYRGCVEVYELALVCHR